MKKVFLCAILASLSYPAIASSLQDQLSAVAEAEQQGKNEEQRQHDEWVAERNREIQQEKQRRANAQAGSAEQKERRQQQRIQSFVRINWTPKPPRIKNAIKVMKMSCAARDSETKAGAGERRSPR